MMSPPAAGISAFPESDSDLTYWVGRLEGAEVRSLFPCWLASVVCWAYLSGPATANELPSLC